MSVPLSSYRLGDLVLLQLNDKEKDEIVNDYPNSIASDFILETRKKNINSNKMNVQSRIQLVTKIALDYLLKYKDLIPEDIKDSTLIHLRLGDVVSGTYSHEVRKRPLHIDNLKKIVPKNNKIYIIGKPFFGKPSSTNYEECTIESEKYLQNVLTTFNATHFMGENADIDLCCGLLSKVFVQGRGYYSKLIVEIRKKIGKRSIETSVIS